MPLRWIKRILVAAVVAGVAVVTVWAFLPAPIPAGLAIVDRGPIAVTIDEEGIANIRDVYRVSAPISGTLERLPLHVGDAVVVDQTVVASIRPLAPAFLDVRSRREIEAGVDAAIAAVRLAQAQLDSASSTQKLAEAAYARAQQLSKSGTISTRDIETATNVLDTAKAATEEGRANLARRQSELNSARARLIEPGQQVPAQLDEMCCLNISAPSNGMVLKLLTESQQVVTAGTPLLEIGDPSDLEIVVRLLSSDAVLVATDAPATVTNWGGPAIDAKVRRVDPAAYTKVSALGIEEQRVDARLDILNPYDVWKALGHSFHVMVHIQTWSGSDVRRVPISALFRRGADWYVYRAKDGRAVLTRVAIDHRNTSMAEVVSGLMEGDSVVLHPSDRIADGIMISARQGI